MEGAKIRDTYAGRCPLPRPATRETYHHGNLRRALIDAAVRLVAEGGPDAFTVSEAAREAGVSSGAPYRHFPDRRALLRAVAAEGLELHAEALEAAVEAAGGDARTRLQALAEAEVRFAVARPAYFRVMSTPEYRDRDEEYAAEIEANRARLAAAPRSRDAAATLAAQCAIYGLARMAVDGQLGDDVGGDELADAVRAMLATIRAR